MLEFLMSYHFFLENKYVSDTMELKNILLKYFLRFQLMTFKFCKTHKLREFFFVHFLNKTSLIIYPTII